MRREEREMTVARLDHHHHHCHDVNQTIRGYAWWCSVAVVVVQQ
jgi:hypothetical protein